MALSKEKTASLVKKYGKSSTDTGSTSVQIAILTQRIKDLTEHLKSNGQDANARRSLLALVGQRQSLLSYLARTDRDEYTKVIESLSIRSKVK